MMMNWSLLLLSLCLIILLPRNAFSEEDTTAVAVEYGVDVSYPMQHLLVSTNYPWLPHNVDPTIPTPPEYVGMPIQPLGDRQKFYGDLLQSCEDTFGNIGECLIGERERIEMSLRQPQSMKNFTEMGFLKMRAPENVFKLIHEFWVANQHRTELEDWGKADMVTNNWLVNSTFADVGDDNLKGGGDYLQKQIWSAAKDTIQEWTGQKLDPSSLYGVRVYHGGAILAPHVDRLPLVSSAIIQVDQDVDEPWPLEVIDHDGKAHNVTMEPGDMVLYESHSVLHGRPFPLKGRYVANVFIHFEPAGNNAGLTEEQIEEEYLLQGIGSRDKLPDYILPDSPEAELWHKQHPKAQHNKATPGTTPVHVAAQENDLNAVQDAIERDQNLVNARDSNGWTPLHEAARMGHLDVVEWLLENGADVNSRTGHDNSGGSVLWWAITEVGEDHPIVDLLESYGAEEVEPEL